MRPPEQADDGALEVTPLDTRPASRRGGRWPRLSRRWRVALAVAAIALAVIVPFVSLPPTRALLTGRRPSATAARPTPTATTPFTITNVTSSGSDVAPAEWDALRARPLFLPTLAPGASCPAAPGRSVQAGYGPAIGEGPVYIVGMGTDGVLHAVGPTAGAPGVGAWGFQFSIFIIAPAYKGPVLARGQQLDGSHVMLFNGGIDQQGGFTPSTPILLRQMRLEGGPDFGAPWATWLTYVRMQAPGCYGIQFDGVNFHEIVIFHVVFGG